MKNLNGFGEIKYEHLFVDGTKIEANANKYSFVWKKNTSKYQDRLNNNIEKLMEEINKSHHKNYTIETPLDCMLNGLKNQATEPFVHGRGKRKTQVKVRV